MSFLNATIDHKIRVRPEALGEQAYENILEAMEIPNMAKEVARKQDLWGWQRLPDTISLAEHDDSGELVLPRGFAHQFVKGLFHMGVVVDWNDQRTWKPKFRAGNRPEPDSWQVSAIENLISTEQGIYKAPAGSGKTVTVLIAIQRLAAQSLVIVNTKDILWQWRERASQFLGPDYPVGQIGDDTFQISPYLTIATEQTIHARFDVLEEQGFFDAFSIVCLDECHHAQAATYNRTMSRFSARFRWGVSATPDKTGDFALALNVLGPIIHETKPESVDRLIKPEVIRVPTDFTFAFRGQVSRWQRSNYGEMVTALVRNPDRNDLIVSKIMENAGHHQLIVSKRLEHLRLVKQMLLDAGFPDPIVTITGKDDNDARKEAKELAENFPCVILSTLADEAMDIPRLDRMHLIFPQKNPGLVTQQVGRVERKHPDKTEAIIFDYADTKVGPLEAQWRTRRTQVYMPRGYKISTERKAKSPS